MPESVALERKKKEVTEAISPVPELESAEVHKGDMHIVGSLTVTDKIIVKSGDGRASIVLQAMEDIAGVWIEAHPDGDKHPRSLIALYDDKQSGPVIGFYRDTGEKGLAMTCAIAVDDDGRPCVQIVSQDGKVGHLGLEELLNLVKPAWRG